MNLKNIKNLKQGLLDLTPEQQLYGKLIGIIGGIIGLTLALASLLLRQLWGFSIFVFFIIWIQVISYVGTRQQYKSTKELMVELKAKQQDMEDPIIDKRLGND